VSALCIHNRAYKPPGTYYFSTYYAGSSVYREEFSPTAKVMV